MISTAERLNETLRKECPSLFSVLSKRGRHIYYPKEGILAQTEEAQGTELNATIGIALDEEKKVMCLPSLMKGISLSPEKVVPYAFSYGLPSLRTAWKEHQQAMNPSLPAVSKPVVCAGLTHALSVAGYLFVEEGDRIILPEPLWGNYRLIFESSHGGVLDTFPMFDGKGFNVKGLKAKLLENGQKKIVLLNFPHNPTGYSCTKEEANGIAEAVKDAADEGKQIVVLCDDAYAGFTYTDEAFKESFFSVLSSLHERVIAVKIDGMSKEGFAWGLRVGFITIGTKKAGYTTIENKLAGVVRATVSNVSMLSQCLALQVLTSGSFRKEQQEHYRVLKKRYEMLLKIIRKTSLEALPCNSGYFLCIKVRDAESARQRLLKEYKTGVIATQGLLRIAFSGVPTYQLEKLVENIVAVSTRL